MIKPQTKEQYIARIVDSVYGDIIFNDNQLKLAKLMADLWPAPPVPSDAVAFAEWASNERWHFNGNDGWYKHGRPPKVLSAALYQQFITETQQ